MRKYLYIITRSGNTITDKGLDKILNILKYDQKKLTIEMGHNLNDPSYLSKILDKNPGDIVIVETTNDNISDGYFILGDRVNELKDMLSQFSNSWDAGIAYYNKVSK